MNHDNWPEPDYAANRMRQVIADKAVGICTDCGLEDADATRFDGMYCVYCANDAETTIS